MTTALQQQQTQDFGLDPCFEPTQGFSAENMSESSESSSSTQSHVISNSVAQGINEGTSCSTPNKDEQDSSHVYANIREMEEMNSRPVPPTPSQSSEPRRDLQNGWFEYETDAGRTFFFNRETGKSQWMPPRFIRTPAQVQEFLRMTRTEFDETCTFEGPSSVSSEDQKENKQIPQIMSESRKSISVEDEEVFDEVCDELTEIHPLESSNGENRPNLKSPDYFSDDLEESDEEACSTSREPSSCTNPMPHPYIPPIPQKTSAGYSPYVVPPDATGPGANTSYSEVAKTPGTTRVRKQSPTGLRSVSFQNKCTVVKNMVMPQMMPTSSSLDRTPDRGWNVQDVADIEHRMVKKGQERRGSSESREPVMTIRSGYMERSEQVDDMTMQKLKKREWFTNYMYLTSAHLILYKDQKSAEKHGKHYDAPLGVWDLRGSNVTWNDEKDVKKKRKYMQLELCNSAKYLLRTSNESDTIEWFRALEDVVVKLPAPGSSTQAVIDVTNANVVRNPSYLGSTRPLSHALLPISRSLRRRDDPMSQSAIETSSSNSAVVEESRPSKDSILEKLRRFFRTRPTVESLKEKGIYKPEPVFGSTLAAICQPEGSFVPKFIRVITEVIESKGLETDGIYRVSGNLSAVQKIRCQADQDNYKALVAEEDIHVLTGALKLFFRELAEPLFPTNLQKEYTSAMQTPHATTRLKKFEELLGRLPNENRETLKALLRHLNRVASHSSQNRMQQHNLAIVFGPTLFHNGDGAVTNLKNKKAGKKGKTSKNSKEEASAPVQSNSHLAFSMIMQSQIVQYLLESANKFDILKAPVNYGAGR